MLRVHHVGRDTDIGNGIEKLGLLRGMRHAVENIAEPMIEATKTSASFVKYTVDEPARLLAGIYLFGDIMYAGSGDNLEGPAKHLKQISGVLATLQSVLFLSYAKDGSEHHLKEVRTSMEEALSKGENPFDPEKWKEKKPDTNALVGRVDHILKRHPIEIGSSVQILGQLCLLA